MKQRITIEQLNELSEEQKERLREWWWGANPRLSDIYAVKVKYDDITRYEGPYVLSGHRDFHEDYHTGEALPMISIGQMIEYLRTKSRSVIEEGNDKFLDVRVYGDRSTVDFHGKSYTDWTESDGELCDYLWLVVKEIL